MAGFDERCPYCGADMECRKSWDYENEYNKQKFRGASGGEAKSS